MLTGVDRDQWHSSHLLITLIAFSMLLRRRRRQIPKHAIYVTRWTSFWRRTHRRSLTKSTNTRAANCARSSEISFTVLRFLSAQNPFRCTSLDSACERVCKALFRVLVLDWPRVQGVRMSCFGTFSVSLRWRFRFVVSCLLWRQIFHSATYWVHTRIDTWNGIYTLAMSHAHTHWVCLSASGKTMPAIEKMKLKCRVRVTRSEAVSRLSITWYTAHTHFELDACTADTSTTVIITIKYNAIYIITINDDDDGGGSGHNWSTFERAKEYLSRKISFLLVSCRSRATTAAISSDAIECRQSFAASVAMEIVRMKIGAHSECDTKCTPCQGQSQSQR